MDLQQLEFNTPLRIKFASKDENGNPARDAYTEYRDLFPDQVTPLEEDWVATRSEKIKTRAESYDHNTWIFSHDQIKIGAVEHETGIKFLIEIAAGVAVTVISSFVMRMWNKWGASRKKYYPNKGVSFVLEINSKTFPDGRSKTDSRIERSGPVDQTIIYEVEKALDKLRTELDN